jgi:hypothetical protein
MICWLLEVPRSKPGYLVRQSMNREILRGLMWCCTGQDQPDLMRAIRVATEFLYAKNSPLAVTGLQVLLRLPGEGLLDELARLAGSVKADSQRRLLQSARKRIASRTGASVEELDDPILPTMDLVEVGLRREVYSGYTVELRVTGPQSVSLHWFKPDGSPQKTLPAKVKRNHAREVAALKDSVKGIRQTLSLASGQLESSLLTAHTWQQSAWRQRYFDHPVAGTLGRRLIWSFTDGEKTQDAFFHDGRFVDCRGLKVEVPKSAKVSLWHPINAAPQTVLSWREFLFERQVTQPFKQAHREVYVLTDAERETGTYSNRFAAHVLRQPQFRALAKARGWKSPYFGHWDGGGEGVPHKELPHCDMRAEFWVDAASDAFAEAGGYLYLTTDQVRFFQPRDAREPMPLADVPPLVFTEIMRDVDLFVGVGSVGNDPHWHDGGPRGVHAQYWHDFSFGELAASAVTRKEVLERLIPRLKIADRCSFDNRFLVVRGYLRTYKIHLGSGNILMEPNDQYLCIVPKRSSVEKEPIFLPFEGDNTLSVILSKAFLLANDTEITDQSIVSQILV